MSLSFFSIPGLKLYAVLLTIFWTICSTHQTLTISQNLPDCTLDSIFVSTLHCIKVSETASRFHKIFYPTSSCIAINLRPVFYILQYCDSTQMTLRHLFLSWGIFDSISDSISSSTYGQCINITIVRGG